MRILLFKPYGEMPSWWCNFFKLHYKPMFGPIDNVNELNRSLLPFNCVFSLNVTKKGHSCRYLHFNTKGDYLMFILRWS
jgi:hypothetical protein